MLHSIEVDVSVFVTVGIALSDEPTPEEVIEAEKEAVRLATAKWEGVAEGEVSEWIGGRPKTQRPVPDGFWLTAPDGHRWAITGTAMIRDDAPLPDPQAHPAEWLDPDDWEGYVPIPPPVEPEHPVTEIAYYRRCYSTILRAGSLVRNGGPLHPVIVIRDGEPIAAVAPVRHKPSGPRDFIAVNADGRIVEGGE